MGTIHREDGLRFFFYSNEHPPAHVHVKRDDVEAKIVLVGGSGWPELVSADRDFKAPDIKRAVKIAQANRDEFLRKWNETHGKPSDA